MKPSPLQICNAIIQPGEKATLALPLPEQYSCSPMFMPIKVINGTQKGPCLLGFATINGDEFNGLEILNQLFDLIAPKTLKGSLIIVPVLNVYGLSHYPKSTPSGVSINNSFPGHTQGNFGERVAHIFTEEILKKIDYCIECQTGSLNHEILPQIYCDVHDPEVRKLAKSFQAPMITEVKTTSSTLRQTTENLNIPLLVYEAGEAMRFDQTAIQIGIEGMQNVLKTLGMLSGSVNAIVNPVFSQDNDWISSPASGILHTEVNLGESIKKGTKIAHLSDPFSNESATVIYAQMDGIVVGINRSPLIQEGSSIFKIASFIDNKRAEAFLEEWDEIKPIVDE